MPLIPTYYYDCPNSLEALSQCLSEKQDVLPTFLAGGTDLWVNIQGKKKKYPWVIDLKGIPGLADIEVINPSLLKVGALVNMNTIEKSPIIRQHALALAEAAQNVGSYQIRNRATIGGNIGNGAPTADTAIALLALGVEVHTWSPQGARAIPIDAFWLQAGKTCLAHDEFITHIQLPIGAGMTSAFIKQGPRRAMDIAIVNTAVNISIKDHKIAEARIALGGAGSTPLRAKQAEEYLKGKTPEIDHFQEASQMAVAESNPRSSSRASKEYRLDLIAVLVERALQKTMEEGV